MIGVPQFRQTVLHALQRAFSVFLRILRSRVTNMDSGRRSLHETHFTLRCFLLMPKRPLLRLTTKLLGIFFLFGGRKQENRFFYKKENYERKKTFRETLLRFRFSIFLLMSVCEISLLMTTFSTKYERNCSYERNQSRNQTTEEAREEKKIYNKMPPQFI